MLYRKIIAVRSEGQTHYRITLCGYRNSLRDGRYGDRITVGAKFSEPAQTGPGAHPGSYTTDNGSFPGKATEG